MAVKDEYKPVTEFADWYQRYEVDSKGCLTYVNMAPCAGHKWRQYMYYKREMELRTAGYEKYEKQAAAEFVSTKPDLPNVSSGESAGFVRRMARNTVQHTPNVEISNEFDDESIYGHMARYMLLSKIIGDDEYSNNMQQALVTTARRGFTLGFDCVIPVLLQNAMKQWYVYYDTINYRDVFPEPGAKDVRRATDIYVRRYLTKGEIHGLIESDAAGWDVAALRRILKTEPVSREYTSHEQKKQGSNPQAYEIITWYSNTGAPFLTFDAREHILLRIEKNKHPLKEHPVMFFVPERDEQQPLGKSLLSLTFGRQEFQDLFLNGSMKLWWRNINPPIIGYGTVNAVPNLSPGKYTQISNPNAKVEAFEVNTQSLMMFNQISQGNQAGMVSLLGAADQQMASQNTGGMMSQTPQGVEAQQAMVDITTNNYQKAMEVFFSRYCSYALTIYFQELKGVKSVTPTSSARKSLIDGGLPQEAFKADGSIDVDFSEMAKLYWVKVVPGSLVEMEDEKQIRILNQLFVPLSQSMPALAQTGDVEALKAASAAMQYIVQKQIELSGSQHSTELKKILQGKTDQAIAMSERTAALEARIDGSDSDMVTTADLMGGALLQMQEQVSLLAASQAEILRALRGEAPTQPAPEAATSGDSGGYPAASAPQGAISA